MDGFSKVTAIEPWPKSEQNAPVDKELPVCCAVVNVRKSVCDCGHCFAECKISLQNQSY